MAICRTCLSTPADKDIFGLENDINEGNKTYRDIMLFCLDIKVTRSSPITTNLCHNCYRKIISFYKFKKSCLKNDAYLNSLGSDSPDHDIKNEHCSDSDEFGPNFVESKIIELKQEINVKQEDTLCQPQSDDELLSVIQKVKYENNSDETKENALMPKKRGRPKKIKLLSQNVKNGRQVCEECGKSVVDLKEHSLIHKPKEERRKLPCKLCSKTFSSYSARFRHIQVKHLGIKKQCDICKKEVVCLKQHMLVVHNTSALPHGCVSCGRRFISLSALEVHMTSHTKKTPFECDQCEKKFRAKFNLDLHKRRVHDKEKTNLCQFCSKTFFKKYHLQVHLRSHTKERPYECTVCGKFFSSTTTLKDHRLTHSEDKPHRCQLCLMAFAKPGYLKNHMISHTRERPHPCKYCGLRFGRTDHRKRHEFTAHEKHVTLT